MPLLPRAEVQPPRKVPPTLTLIGASRTLLGDPDLGTGAPARWEGGVTFRSLPCDVSFAPFLPDCASADLSSLATAGVSNWDSIVLWAGETCTTAGVTPDVAETRVRELLAVDRHRQLEYEFWTGSQAQAATPDAPNLWLAMDNVVVELAAGAATPLTQALTMLQQALADCAPAGRGMIHATVRTAGLWYALGLLRREGAVLLDVFDNVVVPGVGYPGSAPDGTVDATGASAWAYATGIVDTRLGDVQVIHGVDPASNNAEVIAQQSAVAYWDGCCHLGINVDHTTSGVTGAAPAEP